MKISVTIAAAILIASTVSANAMATYLKCEVHIENRTEYLEFERNSRNSFINTRATVDNQDYPIRYPDWAESAQNGVWILSSIMNPKYTFRAGDHVTMNAYGNASFKVFVTDGDKIISGGICVGNYIK